MRSGRNRLRSKIPTGLGRVGRQREVGHVALGMLMAALVLVVQYRPLFMFFGPDDFIHMEQAVGLLPPPVGPFRALSQVYYFRWMLAWVGPNAQVFHALNLLLHCANTLLLIVLLRRAGFSRELAGLSGVLYGCMPLHYLTLLYAVHMNDILAFTMLLTTMIALQSGRAWAVGGAALSFGVGLASKESILALPLVAPVLFRGSTLRESLKRMLGVGLVGALFLGVFLALRAHGMAPGGATYAITVGPKVLGNIATYLAWLLDLTNPMPDVAEATTMRGWASAVGLLVLTAIVAWRWPNARRGTAVGVLWFLAAGLPVFVLAAHAYAHYLYIPAVGVAIVVAALVLTALEHSGSRLRRLLLCGLCIGYAIWSSTLIERRMTTQLPGIAVPRDIATRKTVLAARTVSSIAGALAPDTRLVVLFSPRGEGRVFGALSGRERNARRISRGYDALAEVLDQGRALRLFFPQLDEVRFTQDWNEISGSDQVFWRIPDGRVVSLGAGDLALRALADALAGLGHEDEANEIRSSVQSRSSP